MSGPAPRPALRKAPDAHVHPAAPAHSAHRLGHAGQAVPSVPGPPLPGPPASQDAVGASTAAAPAAELGRKADGKGRGLSGPPGGTTSDMLRAAGKAGRRAARGLPAEKLVELTVKVPKSLRKEFRAAAKANRADPDEVVTSLLRAWLHG